MISLNFAKQHRSILTLPSSDLPDFTVITGVNGSGKSHLLEAIKNGCLTVSGIRPSDADIRLFTWATFIPGKSEAADPLKLSRDRNALITKIEQGFDAAQKSYTNSVAKLNIPFIPLEDARALMKMPRSMIEELKTSNGSSIDIWPQLEQKLAQANGTCANTLNQHPTVLSALNEAAQKLGVPLASLDPLQIEAAIPLHWTAKDVFQQSFSQTFAAYHRLFDDNRYKQYANKEHGENNRCLSDKEFITRFGAPPWEFVNSLLKEAHLDFTINHPDGRGERPFEAKLINQTTKTEISFQDLSSGEKIVMSFALCLYNASNAGQLVRYPKLLLFDEIDAPLHPSMTKDLIQIINRVLVKENKVKVILTTHSPATVALSPAESLFRLDKNPRQLSQTSREQAIQTLTSGYISVTEGSRFVIVEARQDRIIYTALSSKLTTNNNLPPSPNLVFIQASDKKDRTGGGKTQVRNWAEKLPQSGLTDIYGLIDRDAANTTANNIHVLRRYSLENYLLDPVLLYARLMHAGEHRKIYDSGISDSNYFSLSLMNECEIQKIADAMCMIIEKHSPEVKTVPSGAFSVRYLNGITVNLPLWLRDFRGHDLETACRKAFQAAVNPSFIITENNCEGLIDMMTERLPGFISTDLIEILQGLQKA